MKRRSSGRKRWRWKRRRGGYEVEGGMGEVEEGEEKEQGEEKVEEEEE